MGLKLLQRKRLGVHVHTAVNGPILPTGAAVLHQAVTIAVSAGQRQNEIAGQVPGVGVAWQRFLLIQETK